ncbi:MAG: hypothetical protein HW395_35 [candidate division NC10 bacterium]|nr:hypothetical protein [candidate division NC10 bacterium]
MAPRVFRGLWCRCGAQHYQEAGYYVSVKDDSRTVLALGPFQEHDQALARVADVNREVEVRWNPGGRATWYAFGTTAMRSGYRVPGKLNATMAGR